MTRFICFPDDINWFQRNLGNFGQKMIKLDSYFLPPNGKQGHPYIGYNILRMPLVRFYLDYFDGFGKLY